MKRNGDIIAKRIQAVVFLVLIGVVFLCNAKSLASLFITELDAIFFESVEKKVLSPAEIEASYNENFYDRLKFVDINGVSARAMGQKIKNGTVKDGLGQLNLQENINYRFSKKAEKEKIRKAITILKFSGKSGADVLYVQRPWKNSYNEAKLPYGMQMDFGEQSDFWCDIMRVEGIPVLNLTETLGDNLEFYKTDHHWTTGAAFCAARIIINELNAEHHNLNLDSKLLSLENYNQKNYENSFLGSEGIKTGKYYAGKDDFKVFWPKFNTDLEFKQYSDHKKYFEKSGDFYNVFLDKTILNNPDYNNKYAAYGYSASVENRVKNKKADNNLKVLLIADSYARPMFTYLSLCFSETRYLDPQEGRYTDSYVEYIKEYEPDVVVMMFPGDGTFKNI